MMRLITTYQTAKYFAGKKNTCEYVVLHHTGKGKTLDIVKYLATSTAQASCHYVVSPEGDIYQLATDDKCTRHAGVSKRDGKTNLNYYSIGIEIVSDGYTFTDPQREAVRELVSSLIKTHNLGVDKIITHKMISAPRKWDVGPAFYDNEFATFEDYQKSYALPTVTTEAQKAKDLGIRNGERHQDPATREEVATMIYRSMQKK